MDSKRDYSGKYMLKDLIILKQCIDCKLYGSKGCKRGEGVKAIKGTKLIYCPFKHDKG